MLKVSKTKSGNARINLDFEKLEHIQDALEGYSHPIKEQIYSAVTEILNEEKKRKQNES